VKHGEGLKRALKMLALAGSIDACHTD